MSTPRFGSISTFADDLEKTFVCDGDKQKLDVANQIAARLDQVMQPIGLHQNKDKIEIQAYFFGDGSVDRRWEHCQQARLQSKHVNPVTRYLGTFMHLLRLLTG